MKRLIRGVWRRAAQLYWLARAAAYFGAAGSLLTLLRFSYDTRDYQFRWFRAMAAAPRRDFEVFAHQQLDLNPAAVAPPVSEETPSSVAPAFEEAETEQNEQEPNSEAEVAGTPVLLSVTHLGNRGINFSSREEATVSCVFTFGARFLAGEQVTFGVDDCAVKPIRVSRRDVNEWNATFSLPPGLGPGWHSVRLRVGDGQPSNAHRIALDLPAQAEQLTVTGVCDGLSFEPGVAYGPVPRVSLWVTGLPLNADRNNVSVRLAGAETFVEFVATRGEPRQVNVKLPSTCADGTYDLSVKLGEVPSPPVKLSVRNSS